MVASGTSAMTIDTTGLRAFARSLRYVSMECAGRLRGTMLEVAELVAEEARRQCESDQARATIRAKVSGVNATVEAGTTIGRLMERGNKGGGSNTETFRHPTFGRVNDPWVEQDMHPFLAPAMADKREESLVKITDGVNTLAHEMLDGVFDEVRI